MPFLELGAKRIFYTDYKPDGDIKETFIFHHGLGSSQNYYVAVVPTLQSQGFRCIVFDTTGAGRSSYTQIEQSIASLAADVIGILDALGVAKAVLVGHSMGGIVAAHAAGNYGERIVASVWIGPVLPSSQVAEIFEKRIELVEEQGMEPLANTIPSAATGSKASALTKAFVRELLLAQDPAGYRSNCRVIARAKVPEYGKVKCPVLIVAGEEDKSAPLEGSKKMFEQLETEKDMVVLEGVGHWHCVEVSFNFEGGVETRLMMRHRLRSKLLVKYWNSIGKYNSVVCTLTDSSNNPRSWKLNRKL